MYRKQSQIGKTFRSSTQNLEEINFEKKKFKIQGLEVFFSSAFILAL